MDFLAQFRAELGSFLCLKFTFLKCRRFLFFYELYHCNGELRFTFPALRLSDLSIAFATLEILFSSLYFEMNL